MAGCFVDMLIKYLHVPPSLIKILDREDKTSALNSLIKQGLEFIQVHITQDNLSHWICSHSRAGDIIIDLTVNVDTISFLEICQNQGIHYINAALEQWQDPLTKGSLADQTLYTRHRDLQRAGFNPQGPTSILDCGANPGLVSHFAKEALHILAKEQGLESINLTYPDLARKLGVQTIHISEWDRQESSLRRIPLEFANTWSVEGLLEESLAPAELGWGTHEEDFPPDGQFHSEGPGNQIFLEQPGCITMVQSWVPSGPIKGYVIRHGESFTLSRFFTLEENGKVIYRPTVHYAYKLNETAEDSMAEWIESGYILPKKMTILTHHLDRGRDELGVLLMGDFGARWFGSLLDLTEANNLLPGHNATTLQVAAGLLSGLDAILREPQRGVLFPEDLNHERALEVARPFLGPLVHKNCDWKPILKPGQKGLWQFQNLRLS